MTTKPSTTLTPADAREILVRALWLSEQDVFPVPGADIRERPWYPSEAEENHNRAVRALLRAAARLAAYAGDVTLLPLVIEAYEAHGTSEDYEIDREGAIASFADAITWLLQLGAPVDDTVRALARDPDAHIRTALVQGLKDAPAEFESLLRPLADDPNPQVRAAAKEVLTALGAPAWWVGLFSVDPAMVVSPEEAARLSAPLARYAELVNQPYGPHGEERTELCDLIDALPDVLARDAVLRWIASDRFYDSQDRLAIRFARIPDTLEDVLRLLERSESYRVHEFTRSYGAHYPGDRERAARQVHAEILRRSASEEIDSVTSTGWVLSELARELWPPTADASDLLEPLLEAPSDDAGELARVDGARSWVDRAASASPPTLERLGPRVVAAFLDGDPTGMCRRLFAFTSAALRALPLEARREGARRALASTNDTVVRWGLDQVLEDAHDPERDPPLDELFDQLCAEPRLIRPLLRKPERVRAFRSQTLALIHSGAVDLETASLTIMELAGSGQTVRDEFLNADYPDDAVRGKDRGPPLAPEDFAALRRIRDRTPSDPSHNALFAMPVGPLVPEDRAYLDRAIAALRAGDRDLAIAVGAVLGSNGTAEDVPLVASLSQEDEELDLLPSVLERMKHRLGLIPPRTRGASPRDPQVGADVPKEWMDEED